VPETPARRRSVATLASATIIGASVAVLLVSPVSTTLAHAAVAPGSTLRASVNDGDNVESRAGGRETFISAGGNAVAFTSRSKLDNVDPDGKNAVYVRDLVSNRTVMISRGQFAFQPPPTTPPPPGFGAGRMLNLAAQPAPDRAPDNDSFAPSLSSDGRFVAFVTRAHNIVHDSGVGPQFLPDGDGLDVVVVDRAPHGKFDQDVDGRRDYAYFLVNNPQPSGSVSEPKLSSDGSRIVWHEVACPQGFFCTDILNTRLLDFGVPDGDIQPVGASLGGETNVFAQFDPAISGDGQHIVMHAELNPCDCGQPDFHAILSYNVATGVTTRVDIDSDLKTPISEDFTMFVMHPAVNFDGTVISFTGEQFTDNDGQFFSTFHQPNVYAVNVDYGAGRVT
jgi:hypothetical protein